MSRICQQFAQLWVLISIILSTSGAYSHECAYLETTIEELQTEYRRFITDHYLASGDMNPKTYELMHAKESGLPIVEVMGVTRNFHRQMVLDGSTGIHREGNKLHISAKTNLLGAYQNVGPKIRREGVTFENLIELRREAMEMLTVGEGRFIEKPAEFRTSGDHAVVKGDIHPEVIAKLKGYGYQVTETAGRVNIKYNQRSIEKALKNYVSELNRMMRENYPAEYVVTYAVQELLLIHPFKDGNGRTARLIGQILFHQRTGKTIFFPSAFHREMNFSFNELIQHLKPNGREKERVFDNNLLNSDLSKLYFDHGVLPTKLEVNPAHERIGDTRFGNYLYKGEPFKYSDLNPEAKVASGSYVYYGKPAKSFEQAQKNIEALFVYGRNNRGKAHRDVFRHTDSTRTETSGYFSTSESYDGAKRFARSNHYSVVFVIGHKGAEVMNIDKVRSHAGSKFSGENEVIFDTTINPRRIKGAMIFKTEGYKRVPHIYYSNPNYLKMFD